MNGVTGCPAGCPLDHHECGVGTRLPRVSELNGRDLDITERESIGTRWLYQLRGAA